MSAFYFKTPFVIKQIFRARICTMREIPFSADQIINSLLSLPKERNLCLLDSCNVSHLGSHFLIAGFDAVEILEIREETYEKMLRILDGKLLNENLAAILTISYEFGLKLNKIIPRQKELSTFDESDIFLALFDVLIVHDYVTGKTFLTGNESRFDEIEKLITEIKRKNHQKNPPNSDIQISSNFSREDYLSAVKQIQEYILCGDTYQTNLTQQLRAKLPEDLPAEQIFYNLRYKHPAPFAAFLRRKNDAVISASPERFFKVQSLKLKAQNQEISVSPIKGTQRRGKYSIEDEQLKQELLNSDKDRAENVMIVDLLRNDIGRVCKFGSVKVEKLCDLETHPTLFHLVSTVRGELRENTKFSDILRAVFPCGSITGAPKIRTMQIIDEIETAPRGLSMGAIGCSIPASNFNFPPSQTHNSRPATHNYLDFSVAIRTMVVRGSDAIFNVGGGIVIDSIPELEYEESLIKAQALLQAMKGKFEN